LLTWGRPPPAHKIDSIKDRCPGECFFCGRLRRRGSRFLTEENRAWVSCGHPNLSFVESFRVKKMREHAHRLQVYRRDRGNRGLDGGERIQDLRGKFLITIVEPICCSTTRAHAVTVPAHGCRVVAETVAGLVNSAARGASRNPHIFAAERTRAAAR
jgi:hypothetical protein